MESQNICDYSLLVGIHTAEKVDLSEYEERDAENFTFREVNGCTLARDGTGNIIESEAYVFGLIDILTPYDFKKQGEHVLKSLIHNREEISAIAPTPYRKRFLRNAARITQ